MKKNLFLTIVCCIILGFTLAGCQEALFLEADQETFSCDYTSGTETVTVTELPSFTGTAMTADEFSSTFDLVTAKGILETAVAGMDQAISGTGTEKTASFYSALAFAVTDETVEMTDLGAELTINSMNGAVSGLSSFETGVLSSVGTFFANGMVSESATQAFGPINNNFDMKLDFDIECTISESEEETISLMWRHSNKFTSTLTDASFTINPDTGEYSSSGTLGVQSTFNTTFGMTISGSSSGNGKIIVSVNLSEIDIADVAISAIVSRMGAAIEEGNITTIESLIKEYFFANADNYLTVTITAYDNSNNQIGTVSYTGSELLESYSAM